MPRNPSSKNRNRPTIAPGINSSEKRTTPTSYSRIALPSGYRYKDDPTCSLLYNYERTSPSFFLCYYYQEIKTILIQIYQKYSPEKTSKIDRLLAKYQVRELGVTVVRHLNG